MGRPEGPADEEDLPHIPLYAQAGARGTLSGVRLWVDADIERATVL